MDLDETLEPYLIRLRVLAQVKSGDIIVLDETGQWKIQSASMWKSGLKKLWALLTQTSIQPQRMAFLKSAKETIRLLIQHCSLLIDGYLFNRILDPNTGAISNTLVSQLTPSETSKFEIVLQNLCKVATHLNDSLPGIETLKNSDPYKIDLTWCSELTVVVSDVVKNFLQRLMRRLGSEYYISIKSVDVKDASSIDTKFFKSLEKQQVQVQPQQTTQPQSQPQSQQKQNHKTTNITTTANHPTHPPHTATPPTPSSASTHTTQTQRRINSSSSLSKSDE
jgi:hypothetical protein